MYTSFTPHILCFNNWIGAEKYSFYCGFRKIEKKRNLLFVCIHILCVRVVYVHRACVYSTARELKRWKVTERQRNKGNKKYNTTAISSEAATAFATKKNGVNRFLYLKCCCKMHNIFWHCTGSNFGVLHCFLAILFLVARFSIYIYVLNTIPLSNSFLFFLWYANYCFFILPPPF